LDQFRKFRPFYKPKKPDFLNKTTEQDDGPLSYLKRFVSQSLSLKDNIFSFSYNNLLLKLSFEDLRKKTDVKVHYMQIDNRHKCVPTDWYLGYETFAIYTFYQISEGIGYLKSSLTRDTIVDYK